MHTMVAHVWTVLSLLQLGGLAAATNTVASHGWRTSQGNFNATLTAEKVLNDLCDSSVESMSGYFDISGARDAAYFYWFFESRSDPANDPVIVWLTGGPGCSSTLALLVENGPCSVNEDATGTVSNPYSWNSKANIMYVDQPVGVGFSYGRRRDYIDNEDDVGEDLYQFLQAFFKGNPKYQKHAFYIFGESYGGHYAPASGYRVLQGNLKGDGIPINLKGVGVGNGLTDPELQYRYYGQMAYNNTYGIKAVDEETFEAMEEAVPKCIALIHRYRGRCQRAPTDFACNAAQSYCDSAIVSKYVESGLNVYDVRIPCEVPGLCYDFSNVETYLNSPDVQKALHVSPKASAWVSCNMKVNRDFSADFCKNMQDKIPPMLEAGIKVLIYAGDADFICNHYGNFAWTVALPWSGKKAFNAAPDRPWMIGEGQEAGLVRSADGFTFLRVYGAGHMVPMDQPEAALMLVPMDQPEAALMLVNTFAHDQSF